MWNFESLSWLSATNNILQDIKFVNINFVLNEYSILFVRTYTEEAVNRGENAHNRFFSLSFASTKVKIGSRFPQSWEAATNINFQARHKSHSMWTSLQLWVIFIFDIFRLFAIFLITNCDVGKKGHKWNVFVAQKCMRQEKYTKIVGGKNEKILQSRLEGEKGDETSVPLLSCSM